MLCLRKRFQDVICFGLPVWRFLGSTFAGLASCAPKKKEEPSPEASSSKRPFRVCLNVSTIAGYKLPVQKQIDLCAEAGFEGIELWTRDVDAFVKQGGTYETLRRQLEGSGLLLENMIGFASWFADDPSKRKEGLNQMRHDMEMVAGLGGKFIAAPAQGVTQLDRTRLPEYSERYRAILDLGDEMGVTPILELWGAGVLNQLSDTMAKAPPGIRGLLSYWISTICTEEEIVLIVYA